MQTTEKEIKMAKEIERLRDLLKRSRDEIDTIYDLYGGLLPGADAMLAEIDRELGVLRTTCRDC